MATHVPNLLSLLANRASPAAMLTHARKYWRAQGIPCNPMGVGNSKTATVSTYNPVGPTCPHGCPWLDKGCLAQRGRVYLAQKRATLEGRVPAATTALVIAALTGNPSRFHVSGDFLRDNRVDWVYVSAVAEAAEALRARGYLKPLAWAYTAGQTDITIPGVTVRRSNNYQGGGAVVHPHAAPDMAALRARHTGQKFFACPEQSDTTKTITCAACKLCWTAPRATVVFDPSNSTIRAEQARLF